MNSEIIAVGTELLHGDIANTNAQYISKKMALIGVDVHYHTVVGDNPLRMEKVFEAALQRADVILVTGGLGPTKDDITKEIWAKHLGLDMEFSPESLERMKKRFEKYERPMTDNNLRQTYFPEGATVIPNHNGTADACRIYFEDKTIYLLPGPPHEANPIVDEVLVEDLKKVNKQTVVNKKIQVLNLGESTSETMLMDLIENQTNPTIAPYAGQKKVIYRVTAKADTKEEADRMIMPVVREILHRLGENATLLEEES